MATTPKKTLPAAAGAAKGAATGAGMGAGMSGGPLLQVSPAISTALGQAALAAKEEMAKEGKMTGRMGRAGKRERTRGGGGRRIQKRGGMLRD